MNGLKVKMVSYYYVYLYFLDWCSAKKWVSLVLEANLTRVRHEDSSGFYIGPYISAQLEGVQSRVRAVRSSGHSYVTLIFPELAFKSRVCM